MAYLGKINDLVGALFNVTIPQDITFSKVFQWIHTHITDTETALNDLDILVSNMIEPKYVEHSLSPQPTFDELDAAFNAPTENMEGYVLDTSGLPRMYHVVLAEGEYYYERLTKAL